MKTGNLKQFALLSATVSLLWGSAVAAPVAKTSENLDLVSVTQNLTSTSLAFTKNMGQWPDSILYRANAGGATMWFTKNGIYYQFFQKVEKSSSTATAIDPSAMPLEALPEEFGHENDSILTTMVKAEFVGASESVKVAGLDELDYKCNYFIGNDPSKWRSDVPNYGTVTMRGLYPGVDVTFSTRDGRIQEEMIASNGEALAKVKVEYRGASSVNRLSDNIATVQTSLGEHEFAGALLSDGLTSKEERQVATATSSPSATGVSLVYSTYLGGSSLDVGTGIAVDAGGNAYVTGYTNSTNFPIQSPFQDTIGGVALHPYDAFVTKFNSAGTGLIYSTYLGGRLNENDFAGYGGIAVDAEGNAYVTGSTISNDFPTQNPFQASYGGVFDVFVAKLNSAGNGLIYSTYLGGSSTEGFQDFGDDGIAVDAEGNAYVTGTTVSDDFPTLNPFQASRSGSYDAFVTKFNSAGGGVYSTYLGGSGPDKSYSIAADAGGNAYVTGSTLSANFPTQSPFQASISGFNGTDVFVTKINSVGSGLIYSTYLGGDGGFGDVGYGITVDAGGNAYVTGVTSATGFPTLNPFQASHNNYLGTDGFVTKFNSVGSGLIYSTFLGGSHYDYCYDIAVDGGGNAYVTGSTQSWDFPIEHPFQNSLAGADPFNFIFPSEAFVTKFNSAGSELIYNTYLGGSKDERGFAIAVDAEGNAYVTGSTASTNFPTKNPFQASFTGFDAFVTKLSCSGDGDGDGFTDCADNCPAIANPLQEDADGDGDGDVCDNCPTANPYQLDYDNDGKGDVCDNCWQVSNPTQTNSDGDFYGDVCDNCPTVAGPNQYDNDNDGIGDVCDLCTDTDGDGFGTSGFPANTCPLDNCEYTANPSQTDADGDGFGNACDPCPLDQLNDSDNDAYCANLDNCPTIANPGQQDINNDGIGDACCCIGISGNVDCDLANGVDISDLSALIDNLYISFTPLCCPKEANVDGQPGIDISDLSALIDYLYISFTPPAACQ